MDKTPVSPGDVRFPFHTFANPYALLMAAFAFFVAGCSPAKYRPASSAARPAAPSIEGIPVRITVKQRSTTVVPGSREKLSITIDDITRGQVMISVLDETGTAIVGPISLQQGASTRFHFGDNEYWLSVTNLNNALIGEDFATILISDSRSDDSSEREAIEQLIARIEALDDAVFIRNGTEHTAAEAAAHLRQKLNAAGDDVQTASQFIELVARKSSVSSEEYVIRLADGQTITTSDYLLMELVKLKGPGGLF